MNEKEQLKLEEQLKELNSIKKLSWKDIFDLLSQVAETKYWRRDSRNFTTWLKQNKTKFNMPLSGLWRIISSGEYVIRLINTLTEKDIKITSFKELSPSVSPETIELLAKLERVLHEDEFNELAVRVLSDDLTRDELRLLWEIYKPILDGDNARGLHKVLKADLKNPKTLQVYNESVAIDVLHKKIEQVLPQNKILQLKMRVKPAGYGYVFSSVALVQSEKTGIKYHGFVFYTEDIVENLTTTDRVSTFCNYLWLMIQPKPDTEDFYKSLFVKIQPSIGVIEIDKPNMRVIRNAGEGTCIAEKKGCLELSFLHGSLKGYVRSSEKKKKSL